VRHRARFRPDLCRLQSGDGFACVIARAFAQTSACCSRGVASRASSRALSPRPLQGAVGGWRRVRHRARFRPGLCRVQTGDGVACVIARVSAQASAGCSRGMASRASSRAFSPRPLQGSDRGWRRVRHRARFRPSLCRLQPVDGVACVIARVLAQASAGFRQGMASRASSRASSPKPLQGSDRGWRRVRHRARFPPDLCRVQSGDGVACVIARLRPGNV